MITVVVTDDHHLVREGIRALLEKAHDMEVVGEAADGLQAIELVQSLNPGVLVMDIAMPRLNGMQALEQIQTLNQKTKIVILSMYSNETLVRKALQKGAKGYLLKDSVKEELLLAIRAASHGAIYLSPTISEAIFADVYSPEEATGENDSLIPLTNREIQLLQLISEGCTNSEMAERMHLSIKTVERHRANLMTKLNARNLVELIRIAIRHGLILMDE
jgi:DNA-binding NarL/FixJ family response regulator